MNEILKMLNGLTADELERVIASAEIMVEKKRKEEAERARQEKILQEQRRLEEIAELQRKLQELQNQAPAAAQPSGGVQANGFVMRDAAPQAAAPAVQSAPVAQPRPQPSEITCPHCRSLNTPDSIFCAACGKRIDAAPQQQSEPIVRHPRSAAAAKPAAQVRYADESMKKWEMLPGETMIEGFHEVNVLQAANWNLKCSYQMAVTNQRILFLRESAASKNAGMVARMGVGGLVGGLLAEGMKAATGAGPKPWMEIPLAAISSCGVQGKKEFAIVADQTYVLKNHKYEKNIPDLVAKAKAGN